MTPKTARFRRVKWIRVPVFHQPFFQANTVKIGSGMHSKTGRKIAFKALTISGPIPQTKLGLPPIAPIAFKTPIAWTLLPSPFAGKIKK